MCLKDKLYAKIKKVSSVKENTLDFMNEMVNYKFNVIPNSLFRYRSCNNKSNPFDCLKNNKVKLTSPLNFNDLYDSNFYVSKTYYKYYASNHFNFNLKEYCSIINLLNNNEDILDYIVDYVYSFPDVSYKNNTQNNLFQMILKDFRVLCLSEDLYSPQMWAHYADNFKGFCIEYDFNQKIIEKSDDLINLYPVFYSKNLPDLSDSLISYDEGKDYVDLNFIFVSLIKESDWNYEKEWRYVCHKNNGDYIKLPSIKNVYLGANFDNTNLLNEIKGISIEQNFKILKMNPNNRGYKFSFKPIN